MAQDKEDPPRKVMYYLNATFYLLIFLIHSL